LSIWINLKDLSSFWNRKNDLKQTKQQMCLMKMKIQVWRVKQFRSSSWMKIHFHIWFLKRYETLLAISLMWIILILIIYFMLFSDYTSNKIFLNKTMIVPILIFVILFLNKINNNNNIIWAMNISYFYLLDIIRLITMLVYGTNLV
jgi:hypothetical protein